LLFVTKHAFLSIKCGQRGGFTKKFLVNPPGWPHLMENVHAMLHKGASKLIQISWTYYF